ncbi:MAG TPA: fibronectin type III domain-containing protein [Candidatus Bacteroides pullicola]|uniref:Fibronectin type III domain-containing protein n=1 Tax=Candidatus Bacteroides pullicola TaxID=2838475 RepID=A0A9D1ZIN2_9BACE|nr:fibronectin type III domain-containing protein [Candidatus Bacteroides pullicola]
MTKRIIPHILGILCGLLVIAACLEEKDPLNYSPNVATGQATDITYTGATLSGTIQRNANTIVAECGILISQSRDMTSYTKLKASASSSASFAVNATGLTPGTTYYYCAYASSGYSEVRGEVNHFITPEGTSPLFGNVEITTNDGRSATITATITDEGGSELVLCGVRYWEAENGEEDLETKGRLVTGTTGMTFNVTISDLMPSTEYILCAIAHNATSMGYSDKLHVTTSKAAPIVDTHEVTNISSLTATFNGRITSDGSTPITSRGFCYGTDANPAQNGTRMAVEGNATDFTLDISGLKPSTTYYVCAYAENEMGAAYGEVVSFTTEDRVPGIYSLEDLIALRDAINNRGDTSPYINAEGVTNLYTDIDMSSIDDWEGFGFWGNIFEGNGHTISNVRMINTEEDGILCFFGNIYATGVVRNLTMTGEFTSDLPLEYAAPFSWEFSGVISNCHSYVNITAIDGNVGGIVTRNFGLIENCTNHGNLVGGSAGGIYDHGWNLENLTSETRNCTNYGRIEALGSRYGNYAGGIVANSSGGTIFSNCINEGEVVSVGVAGGIVGMANNGITITDCENRGAITGGDNTGGICGQISTTDETVIFTNNINTGTVNGEPGTNDNAIGHDGRNQQ